MLTQWQDPEIASEVLTALITGDSVRTNLTVANEGLIPQLPGDCFVEVPTLVDAEGIHPVPIEAYPAQLAALNRTYLSVAELTVRAALDESVEHIVHAAILDPNTAATLSLPDISRLCQEMVEAHHDLLPWTAHATAAGSGHDVTSTKDGK